MPLELKLRGKSTTQSHRAPIYYVDLVVRSGQTLEQAIDKARELDEARNKAGFDQPALDEAAHRGFASGAFEELAEDVPAITEEFYSEEGQAEATASPVPSAGLRGRLERKVAQLSAN